MICILEILFNQMRRIEPLILIALVFFGFYFCYDFGYLLTGEFGLGQLAGIPFAVVLVILIVLIIFTKNKVKRTSRILTYGYLLTLLTYVLTVLLIKFIRQESAQEYLYHYDEGKTYQILGLLGLGGISICLAIIFLRDRKLE